MQVHQVTDQVLVELIVNEVFHHRNLLLVVVEEVVEVPALVQTLVDLVVVDKDM